ncbi:MAG: hypothetical protein HY724_06630 [Candidatus Rokubacteria bacterium]|nr:hypothetical protein [Candidatus Rokubacteria bacterium]
MSRTIVATLTCASTLVGLTLLATAEEPTGVAPRASIPAAKILASPDKYGEKEVLVRGIVMRKTQAVFPNGRPFFTLLVGDERKAVTVFSWEDPLVEQGDSVEVIGVFHIWRYNFRHIIESLWITKSMSTVPERASCEERIVGPWPRGGLRPLSNSSGGRPPGSART